MASFESGAGGIPRDEEVDALGLTALKELITRGGLTPAGCFEKPELRARAKEAAARLREAAAAREAAGSGGGGGGGCGSYLDALVESHPTLGG